MKRFVLIYLALFISVTAFSQDWHWKTIGKDVQTGYFEGELFGTPKYISVVRYKASRYKTDIINEQADSTSALALKHKAIGALNGSYFDMKKLTPTTFVKNDRRLEGKTFADELPRTDGILAIKGRHKIIIDHCDSTSYLKMTRCCREAIASGPVLLKDGKPVHNEWPDHSFFTKNHPRTIIGVSADGWVYYIVIDGRFKGHAIGASIAQAVEVVQMLGLKDAINLDGGGSSTLWTESEGVLNHPYDNLKFDHAGQRMVPNIIIFN